NKITGAKNVLLLIVSGSEEITIDEIGEINDFIQMEAGHNANIIMGVGEDESLGDAISVTIIATGFDIEQQHEIVNTEPKKIIHALEDEQKIVHDLTQKTVPAFNYNNETPVAKTEDRIVFELLEEEAAEPVAEIIAEPVVAAAPAVVAINKEELVGMTEFIKNLDVTFEIVSPIKEIDFMISEPKVADVKDIFVVEPKVVEKNEQATFSFDLPLFNTPVAPEPVPVAKVEEKKVVFELSEETRNIKVNEAVQFVPVTELTDKGIIRYSLEEYMEVENTLMDSKPAITPVAEVVPEELNITMKQVNHFSNTTSTFENISPMEMTIEETLKLRADERRKKLKEFNYKFHNNVSRIDEMEKEPAYKRLGIDLGSSQNNHANSRISVGTDSNDDLQLRSNNSFLHDNVD
ncbi:MAG: cell division protein FtsZ, partial [Flavobacterium sp.]|nr:cell division protein FtsZ [Flavobacterium sp.]